jgi:hypothetical protein
MSATLGINRVRMNIYGEEVTIPNDNIAKLMYYLDCVSTVIEYNEPNLLTDFKNYDRLDSNGRQIVYELACVLDPEIFIENGIFIVDPNLPPEFCPNKFVKLTDETIAIHAHQEIHANREVVIGGKIRKALNVMFCDPSWLSNFYYIPKELIEKENRQKIFLTSPGPISPVTITDSSTQIVTNQIVPIVINTSVKFKSNPVSLYCPFCKHKITTNTKKKFNTVACCCCIFFSIYYVCIQACRGKNILCCDVIHKCPNCKLTLGEYNAC